MMQPLMNEVEKSQSTVLATVFAFFRHVLLALLVLLTALTTACDRKTAWWKKAQGKLEQAKLLDSAPRKATLYDVLCDASLGATCRKETLEATLKEVLRAAAQTPDSRVRTWSLGGTVGKTRMEGEVTAPTITSRSRRAREAQLQAWQTNSQDSLLRTMEHVFVATPTKKSPLAESVSKIALAEGYGLSRILVVVTDAREVGSTANFECAKVLPEPEAWTATLHQAGILTPGLLSGMAVVFAYVTGDSGSRCPMTIGRSVRIHELWQFALVTAGASPVFTTSELPAFYPELRTTVGARQP